MKITAKNGEVATVDDDCPEWVKTSRFCVTRSSTSPNGYFVVCKNGKVMLLHRMLTDAPKGKDVDHINGDTFDNRMCNLRVCSRAENSRNAKRKNCLTSNYKGVSHILAGTRMVWYARCFVDRKGKSDTCSSEIGAAITYNSFARELHGDYARLNHIPVEELAIWMATPGTDLHHPCSQWSKNYYPPPSSPPHGW